MAVHFSELVIDVHDPEVVADFWQRVLGWDRVEIGVDEGEVELADPAGAAPSLLFVPVPEAKATKNRLHIDVTPSAGSDQATELERLLALGAVPIDIGQGEQTWIVLADPEGNELCLLRGGA